MNVTYWTEVMEGLIWLEDRRSGKMDDAAGKVGLHQTVAPTLYALIKDLLINL